MSRRLPSGRRPAPSVLLAVVLLGLSPVATATAAGPPAPIVPPAADTVPDGLASELTGRVVSQDGGEPVARAELQLRRLIGDSVADTRTHVTSEQGTFHVEVLPAGIYELRTDHLSYATRRDSIHVPGSTSIQLEIPLPVDPVRLQPMSVNVRAGWLVETGFYRRQRKGFGEFLSPEELQRRPLNSLTQALTTVRGVHFVESCAITCREVMVTNRTRAGCQVEYYLDGDRMHGQVHPGNISMHDIAAIEVYRSISATPPQFYGRCGSVVMWSKRR